MSILKSEFFHAAGILVEFKLIQITGVQRSLPLLTNYALRDSVPN